VRVLLATGLLAAMTVLVLGGCATEGVSVRRLPPDTPAADNAVAIKRAEEFAQAQQAAAAVTQARAAASASAADTGTTTGAAPTASNAEPALVPLTPAEAPSMYTYDPLERLNRFTYRFNARFDEHVFLPVANGYRRVPGPIRAGVHNFFRNLLEVTSTINYGLQWRLGSGARSLGRFVINSTIGIGGLLDVATKLKLSNEQTGFSATLSTWGVHPGPYLVIPLLGPSTFRDGFGFLADYGIEYGVNVANLYRGNKTYPLGVVNAIDQRAAIDFRYYGSGSPFEYETIRFLYVHRDLIQDEALRARGRRKPQNPAAPAGK
jgi:phospholipid-binding lipoprotein MlaA